MTERLLSVVLALSLIACSGVGLNARRPIRAYAEDHPGCWFYREDAYHRVALTIDDGPDAETMPELLDLLAAHDATATFFVVGERVDGNEALLERAIREGHELGNHLISDQPSIELDPEAFAHRLAETSRKLEAIAPVRWMRPGSGYYDEGMMATVEAQGLQCALGDVYPLDAQQPFANLSAYLTLATVAAGSIIVLHDVGARGTRTLEVLARVLPELTRRGLTVVTLSELFVGVPGVPLPDRDDR